VSDDEMKVLIHTMAAELEQLEMTYSRMVDLLDLLKEAEEGLTGTTAHPTVSPSRSSSQP